MRCVCLCSIFPFSSLLTKVLPQAVSEVTVIERQSNKLILSWTPGHDGFSPLTRCHIRVSITLDCATGTPLTHLITGCPANTVNSPDHWLSS